MGSWGLGDRRGRERARGRWGRQGGWEEGREKDGWREGGEAEDEQEQREKSGREVCLGLGISGLGRHLEHAPGSSCGLSWDGAGLQKTGEPTSKQTSTCTSLGSRT